ncbi:hypothetical protein QQZ08_005199 [Neonectria magnoliae]|uniref:Enoyl reductase (ER) domain-containing protein n=1 Tax=Neonectria magnoliae TaxID=2732573 RepID=A0ABR1I5T2_9HYPO
MAQHMRAWQCASPGLIEKTLKLVDETARPSKPLQNGQLLVEIARAGLNPADYKMLQLGMASRAITQFPKTPGMDFSGTVVTVASGIDDVKPGDAVLGRVLAGRREGALSEFAVVNRDSCVTVPADFDMDQAAGAPTAALTAYLTIAPHIKTGDRVFFNGGSGGVGLFGIQIAKVLGCHVTVSCSTAKATLCKETGADDIIDYKAGSVVEELKKKGQVFNLIVDNVGNSPPNLYAASHNFLLPKGKYVFVGGAISCGSVASLAKSLLLPSFLGGGKRKFVAFNVYNDRAALEQIVNWMVEGKVKTVIDSVFDFDDAHKAFEHLKKGSSAGKVIVRVDGGR